MNIVRPDKTHQTSLKIWIKCEGLHDIMSRWDELGWLFFTILGANGIAGSVSKQARQKLRSYFKSLLKSNSCKCSVVVSTSLSGGDRTFGGWSL